MRKEAGGEEQSKDESSEFVYFFSHVLLQCTPWIYIVGLSLGHRRLPTDTHSAHGPFARFMHLTVTLKLFSDRSISFRPLEIELPPRSLPLGNGDEEHHNPPT
jgi:hypothetical protein